jgi:hypothetical protein
MIGALLLITLSPHGPYITLSYGNDDLFVHPTYKLQSLETNEYSLILKFYRRLAKTKQITYQTQFDCGVCFGQVNRLVCEDFLDTGRNQVYISFTHGETRSFVLDFDGARVKSIYSNTGARVQTWLNYDDKRGYYILEREPRSNTFTKTWLKTHSVTRKR